MAYINRSDGERFIIPSYRDILTGRKPPILKREILLLAENYGNYIYLQKKTTAQYEVAFSPEPGTLLGETVWYYFKRPRDMIYCEKIPNTMEAILVIVKSGSVYLDGSFSIDSIPDELVVFQTQENNFEIYLYGDVPISEVPEEGKFTFEASSVKSLKYLDKPIFQSLPILKNFQLQPVDIVLQNQGIGVFPLKQVILGMLLLGFLWIGWKMIMSHKEELPQPIISAINPYQSLMIQLSSPDPYLETQKLANLIITFFSIPGWDPVNIMYSGGMANVKVVSRGMRTNVLFDWAKNNRATVNITTTGYSLSKSLLLGSRLPPNSIYDLKEVISNLIDKISYILPGNSIKIDNIVNKNKFSEATIAINFNGITPTTFALIGEQFKKLPLVLTGVTISVSDDNLSGNIQLKALGK
jgi:hypothetical protein